MVVVDGLVLAGGAGRRFGGPKAVAVLGGRTLVERAVEAVHAAGASRVLVSTRPEVPLPEDLEAEVVLDRPGADAPLVGLATGLAAASADEVLVLACDLPWAGPLLARMGAPAVAVDPDGRLQPLCARYPRAAALAAAEALLRDGELRLRPLVQHLALAEVRGTEHELRNVNRPDDLQV